MTTLDIRNTALTGARELLRDLGLDADRVVADARIDPRVFSDPDGRSPIQVVARLLEAAVRAGAVDFGLLLAERRRLANWGVLARIAQEQPSLREAIRKISTYLGVQSEAMRLNLTEGPETSTLSLMILRYAPTPAVRQSAEMSVAVVYRNLREVMGGAFHPAFVSFRHARPAGIATHQRVFGAPVLFDQSFDGLVIDSRDLDRRIRGADPVQGRAAESLVGSLVRADPKRTSRQTLETLILLLPESECSRANMAAMLGLSVRTLQRRLAAEGATFAGLLDEARSQLAQVYVEASARPLAEVAGQLGFQSQAAFNHWHQARFGEPPGARRRRASAALA